MEVAMDRESLPTKEQFDTWCQWKVPRILDVLTFSIIKREAFNSLASGAEMPMWVKKSLLDAFRPLLLSRLDDHLVLATGRPGASGPREGSRQGYPS
jgi:hypothetical protein